MTKDQVLRFIKKYSPVQDIKVVYKTNAEMDGWTANVDLKKRNKEIVQATIEINTCDFVNLKSSIQRSVLLHELGHCTITHRSKIEREYHAYLWAIHTSCSKNMTEISQQLIRDLEEINLIGWNEENGKYRAHILAARKILRKINRKNSDYKKASMSFLEIKTFIKKHSPIPDTKVLYNKKYKKTKAYCDHLARAHLGKSSIVLSEVFWGQGVNLQKAVLLHEIGHLVCGYSEYKSHMWAILRAKSKRMKAVLCELIKQATLWSKYHWNDSNGWNRPYRSAGRRILKELDKGFHKYVKS